MIFAYISGVLSVLTPCTIVLLPIFLYRFGINRDDSKVLIKDLLWAAFGFIVGVAGVALFMNLVAASDYASVIRAIIGMILIIVGLLHLFGKYRFSMAGQNLHPFLWGLILPWSVSLSPCVMPIFSSFISVSLVSGEVWLKIISFALGLISPAIVIAIIGNKAMELLGKSASLMSKIEKYSGLLLIFSGIYLNFQMMKIEIIDLTVVTVFFVLMFSFIVVALRKSERLLTLGGISFIVSLLILLFVVVTNCRHNMYGEITEGVAEVEEMHCSTKQGVECEVCKRCAVLFTVSAFSGVCGFLLVERPIGISVSKGKLTIKRKKK
jgi:cytochrome c biogenesis protein CcdA